MDEFRDRFYSKQLALLKEARETRRVGRIEASGEIYNIGAYFKIQGMEPALQALESFLRSMQTSATLYDQLEGGFQKELHVLRIIAVPGLGNVGLMTARFRRSMTILLSPNIFWSVKDVMHVCHSNEQN